MIAHATGGSLAREAKRITDLVSPPTRLGLAVVLFFIAALAADSMFADGTRFAGLSPHPFWAVVLLVSARFGLGPGLLTATLSTAVLLVGNLPPQPFSQDRYQYIYSVSQLPLSWIVAAALVGGLRTRQLQHHRRFRIRDAEARRKLETISAAYEQLQVSADRMEEHIAGQEKTANTLCESARDLCIATGNADPEGTLRAAAAVLRELIRPQKFSLFLARPDGCHAALTEGWSRSDPWTTELAPDSELVREVIGRRRFLSVGHPQDRYALHEQGVLAGPLIDPASGESFGMLKVEQMAFLDLNACTVESFRIACEWLGPALAAPLRPDGAGAPAAKAWLLRKRPVTIVKDSQPLPLAHANLQEGPPDA